MLTFHTPETALAGCSETVDVCLHCLERVVDFATAATLILPLLAWR